MQEDNVTANFDIMAALEGGESVADINKFLAQQTGFDYDAFVADELVRLRADISAKDPNIQIDDDFLKKDIDEEILVNLSGGKFVRSESPFLRGVAQGAIVDAPTFAAMYKGGQQGFRAGMALPIPHPLAKAVAVGATTLTGAAIAGFPTAKLGDLAFTSLVDDAEVVPSQRAVKEAGRVLSSTALSLYGVPKIAASPSIFKESTDTLGDVLKANIATMERGPTKALTYTASLFPRGAEALGTAMARPLATPTTKTGAVARATAYGTASGLPATGAYFAEEVPIFRESADAPATTSERLISEIGFSAVPLARILSVVKSGATNLFNAGVRALSSEGRQAEAGEDLFRALSEAQVKFQNPLEPGTTSGSRFLSQEAYAEAIEEAVENSPLAEIVKEINAGLPADQQLIIPPLGLAESTKFPEIEFLARGMRVSGDKLGRDFGKDAEKRYQDFLFFSRRLISNILGTETADPAYLSQVAEIQEALFAEALTQRLATVRLLGESVSQKLDPETNMGDSGKIIVQEVRRAKDDADRTGDELYESAKEGLAGLEIIPTDAFQTIQRLLVEDGLTLHPKIRALLGEIQPNIGALETRLNTLETERNALFDNALKLSNKAEEFLAGRPEIRTSTILGDSTVDMSRMGVPDITRLESIQMDALTNPSKAISDAESLIAVLQDPSATKTEATRQAVAYLRKILGVANARARLIDLDGQVETARQNLIDAPPEPTDVRRLVSLKSELGKINRQEARKPGATGDPNVYQLSNVIDGLVNDLEKLTGELAEGGVVDPRYEALMRANAFHRAKHDVFTRTFAGETFVKSSSGAPKIEPELFGQRLLTGSGTQRNVQIEQVRDAVNWLESPEFRNLPQGTIPEEKFLELSDLAVNRFGTYQAAEADVLRNFIQGKGIIDLDPQSPTYMQINVPQARKFLTDNEPIRPYFKEIFKDIESAISGRLVVNDLIAESQRLDTVLADTMPYLMKFKGVEDTPGSLVRNILGTPGGQRPPNVITNFRGLIKDINNSGQRNPEEALKAKEALSRAILDDAWRYASGQGDTPFDFNKFRKYLFEPFAGRGEGPSVATLLEEGGLVTPEQFEIFKKVLTEADDITRIISNKGPMFEGKLVDKGYILSNILIRAGGAIGGNVILNRLKPLIGNVPGASMSVASNVADASAQLGLNVPTNKVKDIFFDAFLKPETATFILRKMPKAPAEKQRYLGTLPTILFTSSTRSIPREESKPEPVEIPLRAPTPPAVPPVVQTPPPVPLVQVPAPMQQAPAPQMGAPNPQQRAQYAALFPDDPTSEMIRGGIGSLG